MSSHKILKVSVDSTRKDRQKRITNPVDFALFVVGGTPRPSIGGLPRRLRVEGFFRR